MHSYLQELQGRMKLPKSRWASNNAGAQSAPLVYIYIGLTELPKHVWAIARPAHPSPTSLGFVFLELQGTYR